MDKLQAGYHRFREHVWPGRRALMQELSREGQHPRAVVLACVDSRVDPAMIFDAAPGELLIIRNVANLVPPYEADGRSHGTSAALEFGVVSLGIPDLIVLGHGQCGGIGFLLQGADTPTDFIGPWMEVARRARSRVLACTPQADPASDALRTACEREAVRVSLENLRGFPWIAERERAGTLRLHGATFAIATGILEWMDADGRFVPVSATGRPVAPATPR